MPDHLLIEWPTETVCVLRMNRPESYNALSRALLSDMIGAVRGVADGPARVLVLAANGPGFCAGADLKERRGLSEAEKYAHNRLINDLANGLAAAPVCTVAAINGLAMGGGVEIALGCDIRFAATTAVLGLTEARVGAIPGAGGTQRLPRLIGAARALEMMFSGEPIPAEKAAAWGLVNAAIPPEELLPTVLSFAATVASRSRQAAAVLKRVVYEGLERDLPSGLEVERLAIVDVLRSADYREGLAAFAEKRTPRFS